ncbi:MAG: siroheme synthase, partial [Phenylobacterium sp.]|nr:siroheme synthase [Phenylobacterium sp.]
RASLFEGPAMSGRVRYVDARGPADLMTLRAVRALAAADVLVVDADAHPDVLALARRDAERFPPRPVADLVALAAEGLSVVRLVTSPAWRSEQAALDASGVSTDVLPIAV